VTEDDARAQAIAKALRERKAHVGDVRAGAKDPIALRGADLLVIDARRVASTEARVGEMRSDVRARWASVATIDYTTLASGEGTVDLRALEGIVSRLAGMDKALTERARKEESFETMLAPLGPTRTLRALALAGPTLHVELTDGTLKATVDLANELLVAAFAERDGQRSEAWVALARVLGMTDATVSVQHRAHPAAMNIMEPVDQALENAAQERARSPELFASEERGEELSGLRREMREHSASLREPVTAQTKIAPATPAPAAPFTAAEQRPSLKSDDGVKPAPARGRTLTGVAPTTVPQPAATSVGSVRTSTLRPSVASRDHFADVPTDPAAPGLLQRMAQQPANDALVAQVTPMAASAGSAQTRAASVSSASSAGSNFISSSVAPQRDRDDDFDEDGQEYDAGEVTVVADASQLDMLRETLGRIDAPPKRLTSTMPAPPGPATDELENVEGADEPVLELTAPARSAAESVFGADEFGSDFEGEIAASQATDSASASQSAAGDAALRSSAASASVPAGSGETAARDSAAAKKDEPPVSDSTTAPSIVAAEAPRAPKLAEQRRKPAAQVVNNATNSILWWVAAVLVMVAIALFAVYGGGALRSGKKAATDTPPRAASR
jgi:hypothetical protein